MTGTFQEIALLLAAAGIGALAIRLRQPLILAYIVVGILAGPVALDWITVLEPLALLAQVGVAVLLATGLGQVILTTVGYFIAIALAMTPWQEPSA